MRKFFEQGEKRITPFGRVHVAQHATTRRRRHEGAAAQARLPPACVARRAGVHGILTTCGSSLRVRMGSSARTCVFDCPSSDITAIVGVTRATGDGELQAALPPPTSCSISQELTDPQTLPNSSAATRDVTVKLCAMLLRHGPSNSPSRSAHRHRLRSTIPMAAASSAQSRSSGDYGRSTARLQRSSSG